MAFETQSINAPLQVLKLALKKESKIEISHVKSATKKIELVHIGSVTQKSVIEQERRSCGIECGQTISAKRKRKHELDELHTICRSKKLAKITNTCGCNPLRKISHKDIASERLSETINHDCCGKAFDDDPLANDTTSTQRSKLGPDFDGRDNSFSDGQLSPSIALRAKMLKKHYAGTILKANQYLFGHDEKGDQVKMKKMDIKNAQPCSCPAIFDIVDAFGKRSENRLYEGQLSQSRALRASMVKKCFADLIMKSQQKVISHGGKGKLEKMMKDNARLEKKQHEEKPKIDAKIRAAELKKQCEREREAARIALQKMEKNVEIYENQQTSKDLEKLEVEVAAFKGKVLEQLGLFLKDDYTKGEEDEDLNEDVEEGEIVS